MRIAWESLTIPTWLTSKSGQSPSWVVRVFNVEVIKASVNSGTLGKSIRTTKFKSSPLKSFKMCSILKTSFSPCTAKHISTDHYTCRFFTRFTVITKNYFLIRDIKQENHISSAQTLIILLIHYKDHKTNDRNKQNKPILHCYIRQIQPKTGNAVEIACTFFFLFFFKQQEVASDIQCNTLSMGLEQTEINIRQYCTPDPTQYRCSVEQPTYHWEGVIKQNLAHKLRNKYCSCLLPDFCRKMIYSMYMYTFFLSEPLTQQSKMSATLSQKDEVHIQIKKTQTEEQLICFLWSHVTCCISQSMFLVYT